MRWINTQPVITRMANVVRWLYLMINRKIHSSMCIKIFTIPYGVAIARRTYSSLPYPTLRIINDCSIFQFIEKCVYHVNILAHHGTGCKTQHKGML